VEKGGKMKIQSITEWDSKEGKALPVPGLWGKRDYEFSTSTTAKKRLGSRWNYP